MRKRRLAGMLAMAAAAMAARRMVRRRRRAFDPARPSTSWGASSLRIDGDDTGRRG